MLWLFGGFGIDSTGESGLLNDLWEFNPSTLEWTWMGGSSNGRNLRGQPGCMAPWALQPPETFPEGDPMQQAGQITAAISGSLGQGLIRAEGIMVSSMTFGSSILPPRMGLDGRKQHRTHRGYGLGLQPPETSLERARTHLWTDSNGDFWLFGGDGFDQVR